ncbi:hypothetical protein EMIHUDRAFT_239508 [Emiliania huxleyi CCMP1516]|uniref:FAD-dependent oxidoreductase domain-containing protein 1 n=2 Tax=Emiliania huxleyi TaxID=2903 RepID=A0A0D3JJ39_EMIH1|nr:hypothetical protein EMIHUDRAFT_239508 [Emiliania huxleyi CCMP1516]EOD23524.1 hypothetical protein EMIHUDRAFT_239508 [Emiliania huxleyi CCMP1516]|eukprot:XP_005775953.1 hypothetical protein EMIHUDRAFT_239508 [Emiliania huxleyi CCMP1516]
MLRSLGRRSLIAPLRSFSSVRQPSYDAVIIGAGVIGTSIATELSRHGWRTLNVDKLSGVGLGSTSYSSGILRMTYSVLDSVKFAWEGYHYWQSWEDHIGVEDEKGLAQLRSCGQVIIRSAESEAFITKTLACFDKLGLPYEMWDNAELQRRLGFDLTSYAPPRRIDDDSFGEPNGREVDGAVYFPTAGYISDPQLACHNLQTAALATGRAEFAFGQSVVEVTREAGRASGVRLADGTVISAGVVVNAAGPHSSAINALAFPDPAENDMRIATRPMRQEVSYVPSPPEIDWSDGGAGMVVTDPDTGVYWRPEVGGKILCGTVEPPCDASFHRYPEDPESVYPGGAESSLTEQWTNQVYRAALRMPTLPLPDSANTQGVVACYDVSDDWTPIYDGSALPGYYMAIGTSGNQFKNCGVAGRLMRELITAREARRAAFAAHLALERVPGCGTIDTAAFSRLRTSHSSANNVMG